MSDPPDYVRRLERAQLALRAAAFAADAASNAPLAGCLTILGDILRYAERAAGCRLEAGQLRADCAELVLAIAEAVLDRGGLGRVHANVRTYVERLLGDLKAVHAVLDELASHRFWYFVCHRPRIEGQLEDASRRIALSITVFQLTVLIYLAAGTGVRPKSPEQDKVDRRRDHAELVARLRRGSRELQLAKDAGDVAHILEIEPNEKQLAAADVAGLTRKVLAETVSREPPDKLPLSREPEPEPICVGVSAARADEPEPPPYAEIDKVELDAAVQYRLGRVDVAASPMLWPWSWLVPPWPGARVDPVSPWVHLLPPRPPFPVSLFVPVEHDDAVEADYYRAVRDALRRTDLARDATRAVAEAEKRAEAAHVAKTASGAH
ncbi:hypothetical protein Q5752_002256 [Cryptotrichosporon argae]